MSWGTQTVDAPSPVKCFRRTSRNDCNDNGVADGCDIANGDSNDVNGNGVPDECECLGDINDDDVVNVSDLLVLLGAWGECP